MLILLVAVRPFVPRRALTCTYKVSIHDFPLLEGANVKDVSAIQHLKQK